MNFEIGNLHNDRCFSDFNKKAGSPLPRRHQPTGGG